MKKLILAILTTSIVMLHAQAPVSSMQFYRFTNSGLITGTSITVSNAEFGVYNHFNFSFGGKLKRTQFGVHSFNWCKSNGSNTANPPGHWSWRGDINPSDHAVVMLVGGPQGQTQIGYLESTLNLRNTNVHAFQADVDLSNPVSTERLRLWIDGIRQTSFVFAQYPTLNAVIYDGDEPVSIGGNSPTNNTGSAHYYFNGFMENMWFVSGRNPNPSEINNPDGTSKDLTNLSGLFSYIRGDGTPLSLDAASGKTWNNQGVIYGPSIP